MKVFIKRHLLIVILIFFLAISFLSAAAGYRTSTSYYKEQSAVMALSWSLKPTKDYSALSYNNDGQFQALSGDDAFIIDASGRKIKKAPGEDSLGEGMYEYSKKGRSGVKDSDGRVVIEAKYNWFSEFHQGYTIATDHNEHQSIIDKKGVTVFDEKKTKEIYYVGGTLFFVQIPDNYIFDAATREKTKVSSEFEFLVTFGDNGYIAHLRNGGQCILKDDFTLGEDRRLYRDIDQLSEGMRYVEIYKDQFADKVSSDFIEESAETICGYINEEGDLVIKLPFYTTDRANPFSEGKALVYANRKILCIDKSGKTLFQLKTDYKNDYWFFDTTEFSGGYAPVTLDGVHYGFLDEKGKFAVKPYFKSASEIMDGYSIVNYRDAYGILNLKEGI